MNVIKDRLAANWSKKETKAAIASTQVSLTGGELLDLVDRLSNFLVTKNGHKPRLAALDLRSELFAVMAFACYSAGISVVSYRRDESVLVTLGCDLVISQSSLEAPAITRLVLSPALLESLPKPPNRLEAELPVEEPLHYFFTSGSTGEPKVVGVSAAQLLEREEFVRKARIRKNYMALLGTGTFGGFMTMFSQLLNGETYLAPGEPEQNARVIQNFGVKTIFGSPAQVKTLLASTNQLGLRLDLEEVQITGVSIPPADADEVAARTGAKVTNAYASTEAGIVVMKTGQWDDPSYCGEVLEGVEMEAVDDNDQPLPPGAPGNLRIKAPGQASSYVLGNDSSRVFADGWFYPGDLGLLKGRSLFLLGRRDEIINFGGVKLNPSSIEEFARSYPGISDAAIFTVESSDGVQSGLAFVSDVPIKPEILRGYLGSKFGEAAPTVYFRTAAIPRSELGKPMKGMLFKLFSEANRS
jgi:acyl-coenzyme A synthetase/AMP-(fatty) acid ligase